MISFLHPWAIGFAAAAAVPVLVHLLTRPKPRRLALSTIRFVREAVKDRRARNRLRDVLVLASRALAVLLLVFAFARPQSRQPQAIEAIPATATARVVVVDVSQSLAAENHGIQLFERARPAAANFLVDHQDLRAGLILAGSVPRPVFDRLSVNTSALREELSRTRPRHERLNAQAAVNRAAELLGEAGGRKELVIVSDFQRTNWAAVDFAPLPAETVIHFESLAPAEPLANLAVLRVGLPGRAEQDRDARMEIEVGNFTPAARQVQAEVTLGGSPFRIEGLCPPGVTTTLTAELPPRGTGSQSGSVRILNASDAMPADDIRPFVLDVRPPPTFALLTHQKPDALASSSYFLERALVPATRSATRVTRLDPAHIEDDSLAAADAIVLDHPGRLSSELARKLAGYLNRGRGILYVTAEPIDATNLRLLTDAAGSNLRMPVEFLPPAAGQRRRDLFLTKVRRDLAPFAVFGDNASATAALRFAGGLASRTREDGLSDDVLASYSDRSACLIVTGCGEGTLAVLNADLGSSTLPASPVFVPLMGELTNRLLSRSRSQDAVPCGEPAVISLPGSVGAAAGLEITGPGDPGEVREGNGTLWSHPGPSEPGIFQLKRQGQTVFAVASALPAEESDLRPFDPAVLAERLGSGRAVSYHAAAEGRNDQDRVWPWLVVACVACLLGEFLVLKVFRT